MTSNAIRAAWETDESVSMVARAGTDFSVPAVCNSRQALHLSATDALEARTSSQRSSDDCPLARVTSRLHSTTAVITTALDFKQNVILAYFMRDSSRTAR